MAKTFLHDADPHAFDAFAERLRIFGDLRRILARIEPVGAGEHFEEQRIVGDVAVIGPVWSIVNSIGMTPV